jgi:branched-subunit amino acid transport protein
VAIAIVIIGVGTYLIRLSFIGAFGSREMPVWLERPLRYVAPAVLAAITLPEVLMPAGTVDVVPASNPRVVAALVAAAVAVKVKNVGVVIVVGMAALWLLEAWPG